MFAASILGSLASTVPSIYLADSTGFPVCCHRKAFAGFECQWAQIGYPPSMAKAAFLVVPQFEILRTVSLAADSRK